MGVLDEISDRLRQFRENKGIKQGDFAKMIGINNPQLSNYEHKRRTIPIELLPKLHEIGIDLEWLILGKSQNENKTYQFGKEKVDANYDKISQLEIEIADLKKDKDFLQSTVNKLLDNSSKGSTQQEPTTQSHTQRIAGATETNKRVVHQVSEAPR